MKSIKEELPNIDCLNNRLNEILTGDLESFIKSTADLRAKVKESLLFILTALLFLMALFVFLYLTDILYSSTWVSKFVLMIALLWATVLLVSGRSWFSRSQLLAREMNMALVPIFSNLFNRPFLYTHNVSNTSSISELLKESSLITGDKLIVKVDDSYQTFGESVVDFHELIVTATRLTGKNNTAKNIEVFKGLFMVANLSKVHDAETYITTQNDRSGFADRGFLSDLLEHGDVKETLLEWNDFENKLHVATNDPAKAREVLTPEFMQDVYAWWEEHELNIRVVFKKDKLYLLIPESSISITTVTTSKKMSAIKHFATSLARPIWRGLLLVEDASK